MVREVAYSDEFKSKIIKCDPYLKVKKQIEKIINNQDNLFFSIPLK